MADEVEDEVDLSMFDLTQKKKKKKKKAVADQVEETAESAATSVGSSSNGGLSTSEETLSPPTYSYNVLLQRVFDFLHQNNLGLIEKTRYTMKPPQLMKGS